MNKRIAIFCFTLCAVSTPAYAEQVHVGCQVWVGDTLAYQAAEFAHQPYVMRVEGTDRTGETRHYQIGIAFDAGMFSARVADEDHPVDHGTYTSAQLLAASAVTLSAPNELDLSVGDPALPDPVVKMKCPLSATPPPTPAPEE